MPRTHQWILYSALTAGILSGCAAGSGSPSFSGFIETTQKAVVSAYETTKKTVVSTYNRITGTPADKPKEKAPPAEKSTGGAAAEGFPARSAPNYEEDIRSGRLRAITQPQVRGEGTRRIRIIPRDALGPGELAEAREKNLKEERIIRDMSKLRERLRGLQGDLDKIRKSKNK